MLIILTISILEITCTLINCECHTLGIVIAQFLTTLIAWVMYWSKIEIILARQTVDVLKSDESFRIE